MSKFKLYFFCIILGLNSCTSYYHFAQGKAVNSRITATPDSEVTQLITPYKVSMDAKMNEVLAQCSIALKKDKPESTLTNWVGDALYHQASLTFTEPIAFVFQNFGGIRIPELSKGPVTTGKIFELMPFDNAFILVKVSGKDVQQFLDYIAEGGGASVSASLKFKIENKKAVDILIHNEALVPENTYFIGLPDYIANGGDNQTFLKNKPRVDKNILLRDMLIHEAKSAGLIQSNLDQRITLSK
jgi:2',3'-cyclic-nucleotide 2'-phosphodiesterase (5'-nucleotidase family)